MSDEYNQGASRRDLARVRLSEWARRQGISRITAYRMLRQGILPVPYERSPTGRWYVLVPEPRIGRLAIYTRGPPGVNRTAEINRQTAAVSEWAAERHLSVFTIIHEVADPITDELPRLELLLADRQFTHILIDSPEVIGPGYRLVIAALAPQGRSLIVAHPNGNSAEAPDPE